MKTASEVTKNGGPWLAEVRKFIQWRAINGESVTWGSNDVLQFSSITVSDLEQLAARIATKAINQSK